MGTNLIRAALLASASVAVAAMPAAAYAQEASYQFDIPAQSMGDALRALGRVTKQNVVFDGSVVRGKRSVAVRGRMSAGEALQKMLSGSGLVMTRGAGGALMVQGGNGGASQAGSRKVQSQGRGTITGTVRDETSGAALKGALVELVGTGRKTSTDDLGEFRFAHVPAGQSTVRISYLGYIGQQSTLDVGSGETYAQDFSLTGGSGSQEIVVYGSRSARAQALNQERTAENVQTVLSSDLLGDFTGTTLSESLRRAPGVVFSRDPSTGDGANIIIRGLEPDLNTVKFNGVELPEGSGIGRSASLNNILTESVSKVTISKTLLPNQDSSGSGGLVEIETKTPLDRPRRYASLTVEGAKRDKRFNSEFIAGGTVSARFGSAENIGISASLQYRDLNVKRIGYSTDLIFGQYLPLQVDGTPSITSTSFIDPRLPFPFEENGDEVYNQGVSLNRGDSRNRNFAATLSAAWEISSNAKIFLDYQNLDLKTTSYSTLQSLASNLSYPLRQINSLGGETRRALEWTSRNLDQFSNYSYRTSKANTDIVTLKGEASSGLFNFNFLGGYSNGKTKSDRYNLSAYSPISLNNSQILPEATHPTEGRIISPFGRRLPGDDNFPTLLLTSDGLSALYASPNYYSGGGQSREVGSNERYNAESSARFEPDSGHLKYIEVGASYERSTFKSDLPFEYAYNATALRTLDYFGLIRGEEGLADVGVDTPLRFASRGDVINFLVNRTPELAADCESFPDYTPCLPGTILSRSITPHDDRRTDAFTREQEYAAYAQSSLRLGKLEVVGGVRFTHVKIDAVNLREVGVYDANFVIDQAFADASRVLVNDRATQTAWLPRITANYRVNDQIVFRAGYYLSVARPQINLLSASPIISLVLRRAAGPNFNQYTVQIQKGNPDLKQARTHSFDFSAEYYDSHVGVAKLGLFYKKIDHLLESSISNGLGDLEAARSILPDDPRFAAIFTNPEDYFIFITTPVNNAKPAYIWGIEASLEKQLTFLPGWLSGFGLYGNYTYTDSSRQRPGSWSRSPIRNANGVVTGFERIEFVTPGVRFKDQASHSGTIGLTYNKYGVDVNLAYTYQARKQADFLSFNLSRFDEAYGTLDLRAEYRFGGERRNIKLYVEGSDLLRGANKPSSKASFGAGDGTTPIYYYAGSYFGGRQLRIGASLNF